ncbi:MAG: hypothetical protein RIC14_06625 [Filomicrobium sp.]
MKAIYLGWLSQTLVIILVSAVISITHAGTFSITSTDDTLPPPTAPLIEETRS